MGRKKKFQPSQFEDYLRKYPEPITNKELSKEIGCSPATTRKNIKILRRDGVHILSLCKGLVIRSHIKNMSDAKEVMKYAKWILDVFVGMLLINEVAQQPLLEAGRIAIKKLPKDEQRQVRETIHRLAYLSSSAEVDGLLEEEKESSSLLEAPRS